MSEYDTEPIRGLPEPLPAGERILWQGAPDWWALAKRALHVRKVAIYCGVLLAWQLTAAIAAGEAVAAAAVTTLTLAPLALAAVGILLGLAWLFARSTVYTITNRRVVMRFGVALPMTVNLPFRTIGSAGLRVDRNGIGNLPLALMGADRIAWLALWPHVRPWRVSRPEPMLRAVPEAVEVARLLAEAMAQATTAGPARRPARAQEAARSLASAA